MVANLLIDIFELQLVDLLFDENLLLLNFENLILQGHLQRTSSTVGGLPILLRRRGDNVFRRVWMLSALREDLQALLSGNELIDLGLLLIEILLDFVQFEALPLHDLHILVAVTVLWLEYEVGAVSHRIIQAASW